MSAAAGLRSPTTELYLPGPELKALRREASGPERRSNMIQRALISVSDKSGLVPLARGLVELGIEIISTGGTARMLKDAGVPVTPIELVTGYPEMLGGRVKTLHPMVHAGLLARRNVEQDQQDLHRQ